MISLKKYLFLFLLLEFAVNSFDVWRTLKIGALASTISVVIGGVVYQQLPNISSDFYYELKYHSSIFSYTSVGGTCALSVYLTYFLYNKTDFFNEQN